MAKCGACGRFLQQTEGVKCNKCPLLFHRSCVGLNEDGKLPANWQCPGCKSKKPKGDNTNTPVKALHEEGDAVNVEGVISRANLTEEILLEIRSFRAEMRSFTEEFAALRVELVDLRKTVDASEQRLEALETRVARVENRLEGVNMTNVDRLTATVEELKLELIERDQALLSEEIEITNLPESSGENIIHTVGVIALKLGLSVDERDVVSANRVGPRREGAGRPRPVAVRLARRSLRDDFLRSARTRRELTTADLGAPGSPSRFYINERLTKHNRQLHYRARELARAAGWRYVWTRGGRIFAREGPGKQMFRIRSDRVLHDIFGATSSPTAPVSV